MRDYLRGDALMRRFFEPFLFEDVPAADRPADEMYLDEVRQCDLYLGLLGDDYGFEDEQGISPTEREFARATELHKPRLIFVKGASDRARHPKMQTLIHRAGSELIRRRGPGEKVVDQGELRGIRLSLPRVSLLPLKVVKPWPRRRDGLCSPSARKKKCQNQKIDNSLLHRLVTSRPLGTSALRRP